MKPNRDPIYSRPNHIRTIITRVRSGDNILPMATFISTMVAILLGLLIRATSSEPWTQRHLMYLEFPGHLYMRALNCLSIPIVIASLVSALANIHPKLSWRIGKRAFLYYFGTMVASILVGVLLVLVLRPGVGARGQHDLNLKFETRKITSEDTVMDLFRFVIFHLC